MKAAMFYGAKNVEVIELEDPKVNEEEILLEVKACGICGTDDLIFNGKYNASFPVILGHEYCGIVKEIGKGVNEFKVGDKVAVDPNIFCGKCFYCLRGKGNLCKEYNALGVTRNGGFAEYSVVPISNVYRLGGNVDFAKGCMVEPLACCIRGVEMANVQLGDVVVILGHGTIGNLILQLARISGASKIIVSEPLEYRRKLALDTGADYIFNPKIRDIEKEVKDVVREGADIVFECSGTQSAQESSLYLSRRGGTIIFFGCSPKEQKNSLSPFIINENELTIKGSFNNPYTTAKAARLITGGLIKTDHLITHKLPLCEIEKAFQLFGQEDVNKIIIINNIDMIGGE